jgi:hypothetical protein
MPGSWHRHRTVRAVPSRFSAPPPGASRFLRAWEDHRSGCACRLTVELTLRDEALFVTAWQEWRQFAANELQVALHRSGPRETTTLTDPAALLLQLANGPMTARATLADYLADHGAPAFLPVLEMLLAERTAVARAVVDALATRSNEAFDPASWWVACELVPYLEVEDVYRDIPVGLLLSPRAMPLSPCGLGPVFAKLSPKLVPGSSRFETVVALMQEWEGSFEDVVMVAAEL